MCTPFTKSLSFDAAVSLAAVVLNSYLFQLPRSIVACTEVKQKHVYGCSGTSTEGI